MSGSVHFMENIISAALIITAGGKNIWSDIIDMIEIDENIPVEAKIAMSSIIKTRYSGSERRNVSLIETIKIMFNELKDGTWETFEYKRYASDGTELLPTLDPLKQYIMTKFITYVMTTCGEIVQNIGQKLQNPNNFIPPTFSNYGYGYGYNSNREYGYGYGGWYGDLDYFTVFGDFVE